MLVRNELNKLKTFDLSFFVGQSYFNNDGAQFHLIFKPILETIKIYTVPSSDDRAQNGYLKDIFSPYVVWDDTKLKLRFNENYLKQNRAPYTPKHVVSLFIVYELDTWSRDLETDFTLPIVCLEQLI